MEASSLPNPLLGREQSNTSEGCVIKICFEEAHLDTQSSTRVTLELVTPLGTRSVLLIGCGSHQTSHQDDHTTGFPLEEMRKISKSLTRLTTRFTGSSRMYGSAGTNMRVVPISTLAHESSMKHNFSSVVAAPVKEGKDVYFQVQFSDAEDLVMTHTNGHRLARLEQNMYCSYQSRGRPAVSGTQLWSNKSTTPAAEVICGCYAREQGDHNILREMREIWVRNLSALLRLSVAVTPLRPAKFATSDAALGPVLRCFRDSLVNLIVTSMPHLERRHVQRPVIWT
ncbi:hypothetical protein EDB83DRAFT_2314468 [Lactarius deliciosus]|nr:hypothetical protein EDB83DRAFT_2314468 [Lactarius deliciosus]